MVGHAEHQRKTPGGVSKDKQELGKERKREEGKMFQAEGRASVKTWI